MDIDFDSNGILWSITCYWSGITLEPFRTMIFSTSQGYESVAFFSKTASGSLTIDRSDAIWIATNQGIFCYNPTTKVTAEYNSITRQDVPERIYVASDMDSEGNLWFSATDFLLKYDGSAFTRYACDGYTEARSVLCDGTMVWIYLNSDELLRFEDGSFTRTDLGHPTGIDVPQATTMDCIVSCDANGTLTITGNEGIDSVSLYSAQGALISTAPVGGQQNVTLSTACSTDGTLYLVKITTAQGGTSVHKVVR